MESLSPETVTAILNFLQVEAARPDIATLDRLITSYARKVPWESASRIVRAQATSTVLDRPNWPPTFWKSAIRLGTGGTCFESNYAFFALLCHLGYDGYLTVNDIESVTDGHSAIILTIDGQRWLADVGIPLYTTLPIKENAVTERYSPFMTYRVRAKDAHLYQIERTPHPRPIIYTLDDTPLDDATCREAVIRDYGPTGLFLDRVVISKIVDGQPWRFAGNDLPYHLETFRDGQRTDYPIRGNVAQAVGAHFGIDAEIVRGALDSLTRP